MTPRQWALRASLIFVVTFGVTLMVMSRTNNALVGTLRGTVTDVLVPVMSVVSKPVDLVRDGGMWVSDLVNLRKENALLKTQVTQLMQWQTVAGELKTENNALRELIHVVPGGKSTYTAARIVSESGGPYVKSALINGGKLDGIAVGQAVVGAEGLVGRVVEAGQGSARVLMMTDINSRVPVVAENSREKSIASGNNSDTLTLDYVVTSSEMKVGERLLTSGDGGVFPPGIPVGVISSIQNGNVLVEPITDWSRLEYVSVVDYQF